MQPEEKNMQLDVIEMQYPNYRTMTIEEIVKNGFSIDDVIKTF